MTTSDLQQQNTSEVRPQPDHKPQTLNKNGKPRKALSEEDAKRRAEILRIGREKAIAKKKTLKENPPTPPVSKAIPEPPVLSPDVEEENESEPETLKVMSIPKQKKKRAKKKIVIMDESSSSSEEEVIVKKKKSKRKPTPPPKPEPKPEPPPPPPKPSIPEPSQEEIDRLRRDKLRKIKEKEKKDKLMSNIFG